MEESGVPQEELDEVWVSLLRLLPYGEVFFGGGVAALYLLHLTGSVIISCHAAALLFDLHGSGLQETISDRPLGHIPSAVTANLHL